jgi:hypothetical protein
MEGSRIKLYECRLYLCMMVDRKGEPAVSYADDAEKR